MTYTTYFNRLWWSVAYDPEDQSSYGSGFLDFSVSGGNITGIYSLEQYFFIFQEVQYHVYSYQPGIIPLNYLRTVGFGTNYHKSIATVTKNGAQFLIYLAQNGELHMTNGPTYDDCISKRIQPITKTIINSRTVRQYYTSAGAPCTPTAFYDKVNNVYRLFYAGTSSYNDKVINYFVDKDVFTTGSSINISSCYALDNYSTDLAVLGNSDSTGQTLEFYPTTTSTDKVATLDIGWLASTDPTKNIKITRVWIWYHAHLGCNTTLTCSMYNDPRTNTVVKTEARTLLYNSVANNIQRVFINPQICGEYVRLVFTDSGTNANYSIDKIIIEYEDIDASN